MHQLQERRPRALQEAIMNRDDAVTVQARNRLIAEDLRLSHGWGVLDAEHVAMLRRQAHDFSLHGSRHYLGQLNINRRDGETFADDLPRSTLQDARGKLVFIPAGCHLKGWAQPSAKPVAFMSAYLDPALGSWLGAGERQLYAMLHFEHPLLTQLMLHLDRILAQPELYSRVYVESFATVLLVEIMACQAIDLSRSRHPWSGEGWQAGSARPCATTSRRTSTRKSPWPSKRRSRGSVRIISAGHLKRQSASRRTVTR
jgi:AraC family transcriptional regulator